MAKNKKSKILASMLAVSTMAVFYATPVMAMTYIDGSDYFVTNGTINTGTFIGGTYNGGTFNGELLFHGNANMENLLIDGVAVNAAAANGNYGDRLTVGGTTLDFAQANQTILNTEAIRRVVDEEHKMSATYLEETVKAHSAFGLQVLDENGEAVATISRGGSGTFNGTVTTRDVNSKAHSVLSSGGLQLYNADGTSKVNITNTGASRFGAFDETSVRIENGQLQIRAKNTAENADSSGPLLASLSEDGLTLVDDERKSYTLSATRLGTINAVITEDGAVESKGDVTSKAEDGTTYTLNTVGNNTAGIRREIDDGGHKTIIEEQLVVNRDSQVISNIGGSFTVDSSGNLVASTLGNRSGTFGINGEGDVTASSYNGVTLAIDGNQVLVGDIDVNDLYGRTKGIDRLGRNGAGTTSIEGVLHVDKVSETVAIDGQLRVADDVTTINADGTEKYSLNKIGEQVGDIDGNVAGIKRNNGNLAYGEGSTTIEKTVSVDKWGLKVLNENGETVASVNSTNGGINAANGKFHVYSEGQIEGTALSLMNNGAQNVYIDNSGTARFGAVDGNNVRVEDGVLTVNRNSGQVAALSENGLTLTSSNDIRATLDAEQIANLNSVVQEDGNVVGNTVKTTSGADLDVVNNRTQNMTATEDSTIFDGKVTVNGTANITNGHGNYRFDDGLLDFNIDNGKNTFTMNSEHTSMNVGGNTLVLDNSGLTTSGAFKAANGNFDVDTDGNITAGTYNGVKIGMNEDGDIILGDGTVIDDNFNSDNVAGITRKPLDDSAPGSGNTTFIEQNTAISAGGIVVTDPGSGVSTKTKYDGFYVKDEYGNNVSSLTQDKLNLAGENLAYKDSEGNINVTADTYTAGDVAGENVRVKADGIYVKDGGTIVSSLKDDGLMLTDQESGKQTLNATDIADIKGIDRSGNDTDGYTTTIEGATSFTKDGMTTNGLSVEGTYGGFHIKDVSNNGENNTMIYTTDQNGNETLYIDTQNGNLVSQGSLNVAGGRFIVDKDTGNMSVNAADGSAVFHVNGNDGTVHVGKVGGAQTVITGNSITTETLNVENIKLGNSMTDKDGNTITIGAAGVIDIEKDGNTVFHADTDNFEAHYDNYNLTLDGTNGFALSNETSSLTLDVSGFAFAGPVNLGAASDVKFGYAGNLGGYTESSYSLSQLVDTVNDIYDRTSGIYKDADGNTVVTDGTWNAESKKMEEANSSITVGKDGATFESTTNEGATNINGGAIDADSSSIGDNVSGGSGSGSSGMTGDGTYTDGSEHSGHFADGDNSYKFTNDANGFTGTVTDGKNTTTIENGAMGSNTTVKGDNASASSGVGIGNDGAFISDSVTNGDISHTVNGGSITDTVTNGDMTVTEVKDENGSATTVKDANGSSTVSQDTNGQTVSTGTGTSVNTGNDFSVTDNETGKSIYMSDIGHVEDIDSEIQNSDGSKTTVVDAVNNEAEIRRSEIERVDGRINNLENRVGELEDRIDKVGAMAAAIANLRTMGYDPAAPTEVAVGIGQYRDETGAALGLFHYPNRDFMLSLSVSTSGDEVMGGIGATWKFGRKSPEKVAEIKKAQAEADARRAEEAKLAKAEEMKQAAKEAKIKAQQERHAKLAAERAAQAEAAK